MKVVVNFQNLYICWVGISVREAGKPEAVRHDAMAQKQPPRVLFHRRCRGVRAKKKSQLLEWELISLIVSHLVRWKGNSVRASGWQLHLNACFEVWKSSYKSYHIDKEGCGWLLFSFPRAKTHSWTCIYTFCHLCCEGLMKCSDETEKDEIRELRSIFEHRALYLSAMAEILKTLSAFITCC